MRAFCFRLLLLWTVLLPGTAAAQWPGEVEGRVVDALTSGGVEAATVRFPGLSLRDVTDASGRFRFRSVEPGRHELVVERAGYAPVRVTVRVDNGHTSRLALELHPLPVEVPGFRARVGRPASDALRVVPGSPEAAGARTLGDLLAALPGVTVTGRGPGSARTLSIRGSSADAVLVLVDGVPLNDPLTGEADLSLISAAVVREVTVLPGARSARYGPRAEAGVVLVETGVPDGIGPTAEASAGSLGMAGTQVGWTGRRAGVRWDVTAAAETRDGRFRFRRDPAVGGGAATRENADLHRLQTRGGAELDLFGGAARVSAGAGRLERGLPGRSFAPSPTARQEELRTDATSEWRGSLGSSATAEFRLYGAWRRVDFRDPAPPTGLPWDETTTVSQLGGRGLVLEESPPGPLDEVGAGWELERQVVRSEGLDGAAPTRRTRLGGFLTAGWRPRSGASGSGIHGVLRVQRRQRHGDPVVSHELDATAGFGAVAVHLAHRSSFSPPSLADQFFRAGVGVEPNPDLRPERVPSELEAGVSASVAGGRWRAHGSVTVYRGDVRDMIVWRPDYRFVWSPGNVDVRRRGLDASLGWSGSLGPGVLRVSSTWSVARVTYDRDGGRDLQLRYRPRHTGNVEASYETSRRAFVARARYLGSRLPVPADVNRLPGFWTLDVGASTVFPVAGWQVEPALRVDRVLDARDSMIFAFPEPGRTIRLELAVRRSTTPPSAR